MFNQVINAESSLCQSLFDSPEKNVIENPSINNGNLSLMNADFYVNVSADLIVKDIKSPNSSESDNSQNFLNSKLNPLAETFEISNKKLFVDPQSSKPHKLDNMIHSHEDEMTNGRQVECPHRSENVLASVTSAKSKLNQFAVPFTNSFKDPHQISAVHLDAAANGSDFDSFDSFNYSFISDKMLDCTPLVVNDAMTPDMSAISFNKSFESSQNDISGTPELSLMFQGNRNIVNENSLLNPIAEPFFPKILHNLR